MTTYFCSCCKQERRHPAPHIVDGKYVCGRCFRVPRKRHAPACPMCQRLGVLPMTRRSDLLTLEEMVDAVRRVAERRGLTIGDLAGPVRLKRLVEARREAIEMLREKGITVATIGMLLNRHYTTVLYHLKENAA